MTFPKDQIQALIAEIDGVLQKATPRLPWVMSGEATHQRRVLEKVRNYLVELQRRMAAEARTGSAQPHPNLLAHDIHYPPSPGYASEVNAQQMLHAVVQEMGYLRASIMQPLLAELETLRQQKESLVQELRQLEGQRQNYAFAPSSMNQQQMMAEFLQVLMGRLQESLPQQMAQSLQGLSNPSLGYSSTAAIGASPSYSLQPIETTLPEADQLLVNLDASLRIVFEALQRDINSYQESLSQGLDRMHTLGLQGEMMFSAVISHLAQTAGRETSSYLQASQEPSDSGSAPSEPNADGAETAPDPLLTSGDRAAASASPQSSAAQSSAELRFPYPGVEFSPPLPAAPSPLDTPNSAPALSQPEDTTDIDAALKLLEQLNSSYSSGSTNFGSTEALPAPEPTAQPGSSIDSPPSQAPAPDLTSASSADSAAPDDLDEFYEMFGAGDPSNDSTAAETVESQAASSVDPLQGWDGAPATSAIDPVPFALLPEGNLFSEPAASQTEGSSMPPESPATGADLFDGLFTNSLSTAPQMSQESPTASIVEPGVADPFDQIGSLEDLFFDEPSLTDPAPLYDSGEGSLPSVSSLEELTLGEVPSSEAATVTQPALSEGQLDDAQSRNHYIPASPDEILLPDDEASTEANLQVWLDESTLSRLSEDLSSLEDFELRSQPDLFSENDLTQSSSFDLPLEEIPSPAASPTDTWSDLSLEEFAAALSDPEPSLASQPAEAEPSAPLQVAPPAVPESDAAFTLEGMDDLFADVPSLTATSSESVPPASSQSSTFTLEGMDDLFADVPSLSATPVPPPATPLPSIDQPSSGFALEGIEGLFEGLFTEGTSNATPISLPVASSAETAAGTSTDQSIEDLFADSTIESASESRASEPSKTAPTPASTPKASALGGFTLERMGDLFVEVPEAAVSAPTVPVAVSGQPPAPFTLEHQDGVFVEVPSTNPTALNS